MTDPQDDLPTDPLDALASAHLDGLSSDEEAARIDGDPDLTARVSAMAAVRAAVRAEGAPVDDARREAALTAALAAFDATADEVPTSVGGSGTAVTPIAAAAGRRAMSRRTLRLATAAAVAVLLALAVPLLGRLDSGGSNDDLATSALEESDAPAEQREAAADDGASGGGDAQAPVAGEAFSALAAAAFELGSFTDLTALEDAVRPLLSSAGAPDPATSTTAAGGATADAATCVDADEAERVGPRVLTGTATLEARPVLVFVYEGSDGEHELVVLDANDCSEISTTTIS